MSREDRSSLCGIRGNHHWNWPLVLLEILIHLDQQLRCLPWPRSRESCQWVASSLFLNLPRLEKWKEEVPHNGAKI
ncbi:unnamed protein product [Linum trigynum]|uniref:Uncharacterized protein n=1 Tax=Linum trigynum TaxID=586398 RepID=A0AAV2G524_9ROSI